MKYKVLIVKNNISVSLSSKLKRVKEWFSPVLDIEFTEEKSKFDLVYGNYIYTDQNGKLQTYVAPDEFWYDEKISKPAKARGFDIVVFIVKKSDWKSNIVEGFGNLYANYGVEEICMPYLTDGTYNFNGVSLQGNKFDWILIHELIHRIYGIKKLQDNTHKHFLASKPEKCLEDFKMNKYVKITREPSDKKQTLGYLEARNGDSMFYCRTLELPWLNNQKNISCIPTGTYNVKWTWSTKLMRYTYEVQSVHNRSGIRFHTGNYFFDIEGCILLGNGVKDINNDGEKDVINSKATITAFENFMGKESFILVII